MTPDERSEIIRVASNLLRGQFDYVEDLNLPKRFGKRRLRILQGKIDKHNEFLKNMALMLKKVSDHKN